MKNRFHLIYYHCSGGNIIVDINSEKKILAQYIFFIILSHL